MTVDEFLERTDSREIEEWFLFFAIKAEEVDAPDGTDVSEHGEIVDPAAFLEDDEDDDDEEA